MNIDSWKMTKEEFDKKLNQTCKELGINRGKDIRHFDQKDADDVPKLSTSLPEFDAILDGGIAHGTIVEIYGEPQSGKTWLTYILSAATQENGGNVLYLDAEGAFNPGRARAVGVELNNTFHYYNTFESGEQALEVAAQMSKAGLFDLIVIDSVAALVPSAILEKPMTENEKVAAQASMMTIGVKKIQHYLKNNKTVVVFVNQTRVKIGGFTRPGAPPPEQTTGGKAVEFFCSYRIKLRQNTSAEGRIMDGDRLIGNNTNVRLVKNRWGEPMQTCDIPIYFVERERDMFLEFFALATKKKLLRFGWKNYMYPYAEKLAGATYKTPSLEEFKDYMIENNLVVEVAEKMKIANPKQYQEQIAEDVERVRMEREAKQELLDESGAGWGGGND